MIPEFLECRQNLLDKTFIWRKIPVPGFLELLPGTGLLFDAKHQVQNFWTTSTEFLLDVNQLFQNSWKVDRTSVWRKIQVLIPDSLELSQDLLDVKQSITPGPEFVDHLHRISALC